MQIDGLVAVAVPQAGTETEGTVEEILCAVGDSVAAEQAVIILEMDKAATEIVSPVAGKITEIAVSEGSEIMPGDLLFRVRPNEDVAGQ